MVEEIEEGSTLLSCEQTGQTDIYSTVDLAMYVDLARLANPVRTLQKRSREEQIRSTTPTTVIAIQSKLSWGEGKEEEKKKKFPHPGQQRKKEISLQENLRSSKQSCAYEKGGEVYIGGC